MTTKKQFELNIDGLDTDGEEFDESDLLDLAALQEIELPEVDDVEVEEPDFSDFADLVEEEDVAEEAETKDEKLAKTEEPVQIVEQQPEVIKDEPIAETPEVEKAIQNTVIAELANLLPQAKQTLLKAPVAAKVATKPAQPLKPMRYPTLNLYVSAAIETWIHNNESEDVDNYLKKKIQQSNGSRIVKVGPTKVRLNDQNTGDFVWTLKGKVYPQVAKFNASEDRWELAEH